MRVVLSQDGYTVYRIIKHNRPHMFIVKDTIIEEGADFYEY